ncbi:hypothetical protein Pmani_028628 [Petrolisthes manimaculis]|uniref:Centromere protein L n=1 Tax=Petrolisthes manimaculis TaxID=1843537 RepID=A0AAE1P1Q5_9EUCA|nr:hypothetical protein Pmani_028628 [Petrolisthes manimaculis]
MLPRRRPATTPPSPKSWYSPGSKSHRSGVKRPKTHSSPKINPAVDTRVKTKLEERLGGQQDTETPKSTSVPTRGTGDSKTKAEDTRRLIEMEDTRTPKPVARSKGRARTRTTTTRAKTRLTTTKAKTTSPSFTESTPEKIEPQLKKGSAQASSSDDEDERTFHERTSSSQVKGSPKTVSQKQRKSGRATTVVTSPRWLSKRSFLNITKTPGRTTALTPGQTPFRIPPKTPRRMSIGHTSGQEWKDAENRFEGNAGEFTKDLNELLNRSWKMCNVSAMSNFNYQSKTYKTKYAQYLKAKIHQNYPSRMLKVEISTSSCLRYDTEKVDAVKITVASHIPGDSADKDHYATVYTTWLIHSDAEQSCSSDQWFPIMIYSGREVIHYTVVEWLQGSFGCYVTKYGIRRSDLLWIAGVWSGRSCSNPAHAKKQECQVIFTYHINPPSQMKFSDPNSRGRPKLVIRLSQKDVHHIWETIMGTGPEVKSQQLKEFFSCMDGLAGEILCLPSSLLSLCYLQTPCMYLAGNGKMKLTCRRSAQFMLNNLGEIYIQTCNSWKFRGLFMDLKDQVGQGQHKTILSEVDEKDLEDSEEEEVEK